MPSERDVVYDLRTVAKFEDFVEVAHHSQIKWIRATLSAIRSPGGRMALQAPSDALDGDLLHKLADFPGDKQRLLRKNGCDVTSAIQADAHLKNLLRSTPKTAWEREDHSPTGRLDKLKEATLGHFCSVNAMEITVAVFFVMGIGLLAIAGWMELNGRYVDLFGQHLWGWPHACLGGAAMLVVSAIFASIKFCMWSTRCRRGCFCFWHCFCCCCWTDDHDGTERNWIFWDFDEPHIRCYCSFTKNFKRCCSSCFRCCCGRCKRRPRTPEGLKPGTPPPSGRMGRRGSLVDEKEERKAGRASSPGMVKVIRSYDAASDRRHQAWAEGSQRGSEVVSFVDDGSNYDEEDLDEGMLGNLGEPPDAFTLATLMTSPSNRSRGRDPSMIAWAEGSPGEPSSRTSSAPGSSPGARRSVTFESTDGGFSQSNNVDMPTEEQLILEQQFPIGAYVLSEMHLKYREIDIPPRHLGIVVAHVPRLGVDWQGYETLHNSVVEKEQIVLAPTFPVIGGLEAALWHDPRYLFSNRFARYAAEAKLETLTKPDKYLIPRGLSRPPWTEPKKTTTFLKEMVSDHPSDDINAELRPHMRTFYEDTMFQADANTYPEFHPGSSRSEDEKADLARCSRKNVKRLIKPLMPEPTIHTPLSVSANLPMGSSYNLTGRPDSAVNPLIMGTHTDLVGLTHPEAFGEMDDQARRAAAVGDRRGQQSLHAWTEANHGFGEKPKEKWGNPKEEAGAAMEEGCLFGAILGNVQDVQSQPGWREHHYNWAGSEPPS